MGESDRIDGAKIFLYGQIGESLKNRDSERLLAIIQSKPEYYLGQIANKEIEAVILQIIEDEGLTPETEDLIEAINQNDAIFREVSRLLRESQDMLSLGSASVGELDKSEAIWDLLKGEANE